MPDIPTSAFKDNVLPTFTDDFVKEAPFYSGRGRALRVVCIGAGAAGIYLGIKLPRSFREGAVNLQIYEKNPKFGGCWYENRYPGVACDIPSQVYSYSFAPNPDWSHFYSGAAEIQQYFEGVALKYHVERYVKFETKINSAIWNEAEGKWSLQVQTPDGSIVDDFCDVLVNATGILNTWKWPTIDGLEDFQGPRMHSANWDDDVKFTSSSTVAVIGNGSSAIQIVPQLQPLVKQLDTYIRSKTWITLPFCSTKITDKYQADAADVSAQDLSAVLISPETANPAYTPEERKKFNDDETYLRQYRKEIEHENNARFVLNSRKESAGALNAIPRMKNIMKERLEKKPELAELLIPDWSVGCRRLTPGVGYLEALCEPNVKVHAIGILKIVSDGIITNDGIHHPTDILVCATGFDVSTRPHFKAVGRDGYVFTDEWAKSPKGYLSLAMRCMPNYFLFNGPNAPVANGSLLPAMEAEGDYIVKMIDKMLRDDIKSICVKDSAEKAFCDYTDAYMPRTIWAGSCRSWYKGGTTHGRVSGLWPGSIMHFMEVLQNPRFEDFDYTYLKENSPWAFMGNGYTLNDVDPLADKAGYLDNAHIEV